jgi:hypothetical protein
MLLIYYPRAKQLLLFELRRQLDRLIAADAARRSTAQERFQLLKMAARLEALATEDDDPRGLLAPELPRWRRTLRQTE